MGVGACAGIVLAGAWLGGSSPAAPSFSEAWYREVVVGEVAAAGDLYQRIYEDGSAILAKGGPLPEVHRRAAQRAGGCFEKIGRVDQAREAYSWLLRAGPAEDPSVRYARLRLVALSSPLGPPEGTSGPSDPSPNLAIGPASPGAPSAGAAWPEGFPALDRLRQRIERRETSSGELKDEAGKLGQRIEQETRLRSRLADLGVEMPIEVAGDPVKGGAKDGSASPVGEALRSLDPEDRGFLNLALAERYYLRGLRALRDRDPAKAAEEFQKALEFQPEYRDALDLLATARGFLRPMDGMARLAAQRLLERVTERELDTVRTMRGALARADALIAQEQTMSALADLDRARSEEEWLPPRVLRAAEVGALAREADIRALLISYPAPSAPASGVGVERYEELRARGRRAADDLIDSTEHLTDLYWESSDRRRPVRSGTPPAAAPVERERKKEDLEVQRRVLEELERLRVRGEDKYRKKPQDRSPEGWRGEFLDLKTLAQWFPESDRDQRFRKLAQEYLER